MPPPFARAPRTSTPDAERYAAVSKILSLLRVLERTPGRTTRELCASQEIDRKTFARYRDALTRAGLEVQAEVRGREKVWRVASAQAPGTIAIRPLHAMALLVSLRGTAYLRGTSLDAMLQDISLQAEATLVHGAANVSALRRKLFNRNEEELRRGWSAAHLDTLLTALLYTETLRIAYRSPKAGTPARPRPFVLEPYTLAFFRKGPYVIGHSRKHGGVRTFALDRIVSLERMKGEHFAYPGPLEYDPAKVFRHSMGIAGDAPPVRVRVRFFGARAIDEADRRVLHESQRWETLTRGDGSRVLSFRVRPDDLEIDRRVLGFGGDAVVLSPPGVVERLAASVRAVSARYG